AEAHFRAALRADPQNADARRNLARVQSVQPSASTVTFARDVAPIVASRCAPCHRRGQVAPFELITYDDVKRRATLIAEVTAKRIMPPGEPVEGKGEFADARRLSAVGVEEVQRGV